MKGNHVLHCWFRELLAAAGLITWLLGSPATLRAGVGPENVIVVVNAESPTSRTIANHYIALRQIPICNVILLDQIPDDLQIDLPAFKTQILQPILTQINARGLAKQARVIAYSADFPTSVDISAHTAKVADPATRKHQKPVASINGLTFFYRYVLADDPRYLSFRSNLYARGVFDRHFANPFAGDFAERFDTAEKHLGEKQPAEAAEEFEQLFAEFKTMPSLAIRAAEAHTKAGDHNSAARMLKSAIAAGWWSGEYLQQHETLSKLLDREDLKTPLSQLDHSPGTFQEPVGFSGDREWTSSGNWIPAGMGGSPYMLSCMLAVVHKRGSTIDQAIDVLRRAAAADHSFPDAGFQFSVTDNVRTKTRFPEVGTALARLKRGGHVAELFHSPLPTRPVKCAGLMLGAASINLEDRKWELVAGAIADNLTSYGGKFSTSAQSKLTDLLHAGAAMSSGTVAEPYALQFKFPLPIMYGYYAEGVTAIEAFYLAVSSPYQLLIVGDPICQPFARRPAGTVDIQLDLTSGKTIRLAQSESRSETELGGKTLETRAKTIELFVNGKWFREAPAVDRVEVKFPDVSTGAIEIRAVLVGHDMTEPRTWFRKTLMFNGEIATPVARVVNDDVSHHQLTVAVQCESAESIQLFHLGHVVGEVTGASGHVIIDTKTLGDGPLPLEPVARFKDAIVSGKRIVAHAAY